MIKANNLDEYRDKLISLALLQYGKKYVHGMMGPDTFDCAGFVWYVYKLVYGINIFQDGFGKSTTTMIMTSKYGNITLFNQLQKDTSLIKKGDIVLLHRQSLKDNEPKEDNKYPGHCGIYLGDNRFIHASGTEKKMVISSFNNKYWKDILVASKDVVGDSKIYKY